MLLLRFTQKLRLSNTFSESNCSCSVYEYPDNIKKGTIFNYTCPDYQKF